MVINTPQIMTLVLKLHNNEFNSLSCFFLFASLSLESASLFATCIYKVHTTPANTPHATITNGNAIPYDP